MSQADDTDTMPPGVFLNDLVREFCGMEEKLRRIYSEDAGGMAPHLAERRRLQAGLLVLTTFFKRTNLDEKIGESFGRLATDLSELDKGRCSLVLTRAEAGAGRLPDRFDVQMVRANVVECLEALIHAGQDEIDAARYIANQYPIFKRLLVGRKPPKREADPIKKLDFLARPIMSWRRSFLDGTVKDVDAQRAFNDIHPEFLAQFKRLGAEGCKAFADNLLAITAKKAKALIVSSVISEWSDLPTTGAHLN